MHDFSRRPIVRFRRGLSVCEEGKAILTGSSDSTVSSFPVVLCYYFLRSFWKRNRPRETWFFLLNSSLLEKNLLCDVRYPFGLWARPESVSGRFQLRNRIIDGIPLLDHGLRILNTTSNGLLFLVIDRGLDSWTNNRITEFWTFNPLTGRGTKLPAFNRNVDNVAALVANDDSTTNSEPHYKALLIEPDLSIEDQFKVSLYSSRERRWQTQQSICLTVEVIEVPRFKEHDLIYFLVHPGRARMSRLNDEICYKHLKWFDMQRHVWNSCSISLPTDISIKRSTCYKMFERNGHLMFVVYVETLSVSFPMEFRVYRSSSSIADGMESGWILLSSMPVELQYNPHTSPYSYLQLGFSFDPHFSPFPDQIEGDKIFILCVGGKSHRMLTFNLENPREHAWKIMSSSADLNQHPSRKFDEKIHRWSTSGTVNPLHSSNNVLNILETPTLGVLPFQPRLDDVNVE